MKEFAGRELELLNRALDGMLSPAEQQEFRTARENNPELEVEYKSLKSIREVTMDMRLKKVPEETWDQYWAGVYARLERGLAWVLISIGAAVILAFAGYQAITSFTEDQSVPGPIKVAVAALLFGLAVLLVSIIREKLFTSKSDKYKEVVR